MRRFWFLTALSLLLLLFGTAARTGAIIALALPLLVLLAYSVAHRPTAPQLSAERTLTRARMTSDDATDVTLRVTNNGTTHLAHLTIEDALPNGLHCIDGDATVLTQLAPGESCDVSYRVRGQRGEYKLGAWTVTQSDPFGLHIVRTSLTAPAALLIEPPQVTLRTAEIRPARTRGFSGPISARVHGSGVDFFNLREYQPGDRLRTINWRATARTEARSSAAIYANQFEQQRIADIGFVLDARKSTDIVTPNGALFEHSVRATIALSESFLKQAHRVGVMTYGAGIGMIFPGYGALQRRRIVTGLSRATTGQHFVFEDLKNIPTRFFAPATQIVFVGPCHIEDAPVLIQLRARGYALLAICPNPIAFELAGFAQIEDPAALLGVRMAQAERTYMLQNLKRFGVQVVDWDVSQPLDTVVQAALRAQPMQRITRITL
jgi:uncharacterized protein (DUF58 family)